MQSDFTRLSNHLYVQQAPRHSPACSLTCTQESKDLTGLEALSGEIFNDIVSYLPIASIMALGMVSKTIYDQVTRPRNITPRELIENRLSRTTALANQPLPIPKSEIPEQYPYISRILRLSWSDQWRLFESEDRREVELALPRVKYTEIVVWLEVMDLKKLPLVTCSICGLRQDPKCFRGTSGPQRSYTRTCQTCLLKYADVECVPEILDKALEETRKPNRLKRLMCVMCETRRHTRDFPGFSPSQVMQLQKQEKRICWECLRTPRNETQIMIGTLHRMGINALENLLDGKFEYAYIRYKKGDSGRQEAEAETSGTRSRFAWELRDGRYCQRYVRLARNLLAFRAQTKCKTRSERKLHDERVEKLEEEYRRGGLLK